MGVYSFLEAKIRSWAFSVKLRIAVFWVFPYPYTWILPKLSYSVFLVLMMKTLRSLVAICVSGLVSCESLLPIMFEVCLAGLI